MTEEELEKKAVEYAINNSCKKCNRIMCDFPSEYCKWYTSVFEVVKEYLEQIEKMKCCSNCKHNSKFTDNAEICWNCERQFSKIGEEILKDEWELAE